jgi:hypothetical protein
VIVAVEVREPTIPPASVLGEKETRQPTPGSCDPNGVFVSYTAEYSPAVPAGYKVVGASVDDVAASCAGATVTVQLRHGATQMAAASAIASGAKVFVTFASPPPSHDVTQVDVQVGTTMPEGRR